MSNNSSEQILDALAGLLRNFREREYSGEITNQTLFYNDLGFTSIDAVLLGGTLEEHFDRRLPFHAFLAELGQRGAQDITVGELVDFLEANLNVPDAEA